VVGSSYCCVPQIRMGKVLEDLDAFAGSIALEHCKDTKGVPPPPYVAIVTASVDRIVVRRDLGTGLP
jgi:acyl-coenzyme A thioesterase 9